MVGQRNQRLHFGLGSSARVERLEVRWPSGQVDRYEGLASDRCYHLREGDREAIALGLQRTGRIVTAAAVLLAVAIGAFATSNVVFLKEIGVGAVAAVLIDAFVVRTLLVPAVMGVLGRAAWYSPAWLARLHGWLARPEAAGAVGRPVPTPRPSAAG